MRALFSVREVRQASARARQKNDGEAVHLAAKWAGKEAFLKAWCDYLGDAPYPFTLDNFPWPEIEILDDSRGVPHVSLGKGAASVFQTDYAGSIPVIRSTTKAEVATAFAFSHMRTRMAHSRYNTVLAWASRKHDCLQRRWS